MSSGIQALAPRTLRGRLTAWHLGTMLATLGAFAVLSYFVLSRNVYQHHDLELGAQAEDLLMALDGVPLTQATIREALVGTPIGTRFVMVRNARGDLLYRDPVLDQIEPTIGQEEALVHAASSEPRSAIFFTVDLVQSAAVRFLCVPLRQPDAYLQIGDPLGDVRAMVRATAVACLPLIPLVLLFSGLAEWTLARRALMPVAAVTNTLNEIQATDLSRRVMVDPADRELGALVSTLNGLLERLQRSFRSLQQFAGDVAHQVQTPLTVMKGAIDSAREAPSRTSDPGWLDSLAEEIDHIRAVVVDLQALALADIPVTDAARVDLTTLTETSCEIIAALGALRGVAVRCDVQPGVLVKGDATRLRQVLLNLGDNAVKYTPAGGQVTIRLEHTDGQAIVRIADTGVGIPERHLQRLFERFFRSEQAGQRAGGTGLGLAIAKRIVDAHRGTIEVESQVGVGSVFTITLPRA